MSRKSSTADVVKAEVGQTQSVVLTQLSRHHSLLQTHQHRVRRPSPPSGETDTGSDATRNDKQRRVINGTDCSGVQIIEGEQHQVELGAEVAAKVEPRLRRFASFPPLGPSEILLPYSVEL